jgi:chemotaxis protein methyltransferase WspC
MNGNLDTLRDYVARHAAIDPALLAGASFAGLVDARIGHHGLRGPEAYLEIVRRSPAEVDVLVEGIAVPETWLFRYPASYELLARWLGTRWREKGGDKGTGEKGVRNVLPERPDPPSVGARCFAQKVPDSVFGLRMLSVGCATGEEPCSMAITAIHAGWAPRQIDIDAVDRSGRWTATARRGRFGLRSVRPDMPAWARRSLQIVDQQVDVDPAFTGRIRYMHGDVFNWLDGRRADGSATTAGPDSPPAVPRGSVALPRGGAAPYDVIFCRNLLIYLTREAGVRLLRRLAEALAEDGLLFVGHAELWLAPAEVLVPLAAPHAFALRRVGPLLASTGCDLPPEPELEQDWGRGRTGAGVGAGVAGGGAGAGERAGVAGAGAGGGAGERAGERTPTLAMTRELANRGDLAQALSAAETILATESPELELLELLGSLQLALNRLDAARDSFRKVIYLDPNHAEALLHLSIISQRLGDEDQAARYRSRAERAHHGTTAN